MQIKVLTYNIHKGFSSRNRNFTLMGIREAIRETNAEVVFLQEIHGEEKTHQNNYKNWPTESQFEFLADEIWSHYAYGKNAVYDSGHHGNAILTKFPFTKWENINVAFHQACSRSILHGVIEVPGTMVKIHVVCCHFGFFGLERSKQIKELLRRIEDYVPGEEPIIIAGDFNDWTGMMSGRIEKYFHDELKLEEAHKTLHSTHGRTFPARFPILPLDRIYFRGLKVADCQVLKHSNWKELSDHLPIQTVFEIKSSE